MTRTVLVTGATGKVGRRFIDRFLECHPTDQVKALCHNRVLEARKGLSIVRGSIADRAVVQEAMQGVTHVVHLATCKETPEDVMDVTVKGMFWLLEACRQLDGFQRFLLVGGDACVGHALVPHAVPVTEAHPHAPYPGCYALSKVLEEVMLQQYYGQYDLGGCCVRAPWIMEKDDFRFSMSFGVDQFGGPSLRDLVGAEQAAQHHADGLVPVLLNRDGQPLRRNFIHVDDLVEVMLVALQHPAAHQELFNVCMTNPVDYGVVATHLKTQHGIDSVPVQTDFVDNLLDNAKARLLLGWQPEVEQLELVDRAWAYQRAEDDPRKIWYPG